VTWTVADGSKGRRWREVVRDAAGVRHSLLFETGPDRRFSHLELATPAGLLTLHPEGDGGLHGNAVNAEGVRHVVGLGWDPDGVVELEGSAVTTAAAAWLVSRAVREASSPVVVLRIHADLGLDVRSTTVSRLWEGSWRLAGGPRLVADLEGLPALSDAETWPLEQAE
jgi:hypothetical protein